jgi:hypothetical protein
MCSTQGTVLSAVSPKSGLRSCPYKGTVAQALVLHTQEVETGGSLEHKSSRPDRVTQRDPQLKKKKKSSLVEEAEFKT